MNSLYYHDLEHFLRCVISNTFSASLWKIETKTWSWARQRESVLSLGRIYDIISSRFQFPKDISNIIFRHFTCGMDFFLDKCGHHSAGHVLPVIECCFHCAPVI